MKKILMVFILVSYSALAIEVGSDLPEFNLPKWQEEKSLSLKEELKKKKVVINFWASWCTACINELGELEELKNKYAKDYHFIAINAGEKSIKIKKFLKKHSFTYQILLDKNRQYSKSIGVNELPRTLVIDKAGKIVFSGTRPPKKLE